MALSLIDLLGETLLVARNSKDVNDDDKDVNDDDKDFNGYDVSTDTEYDENGPKDKHNDDGDDYSLVTRDGTVLDVVDVLDLMRPGLVIALYFTSSSSPDNKELISLLTTLTQTKGFRVTSSPDPSTMTSSSDRSTMTSSLDHSTMTSSSDHSTMTSSSDRSTMTSSCSRVYDSVLVVVVASDEACYRNCLATTAFCTVPYYHHTVRRGLARRYRVSSLASLVLLDARTCHVVSRPSLETLADDPQGLKFPWRPRAVRELLASVDLINADGSKAVYEDFKAGFKALYFSAQWCPPCRAFTPQLVEAYTSIKENGHRFEVFFVSADRSAESYQQQQTAMPWPSVAWACRQQRQELAAALQVGGIPSLVLLGPDDTVLTHNGRAHVVRYLQYPEFPWTDESVEFLEDRHMATLLDRPSCIIFTDTEDRNVLEQYRDLLLPVAEEYLVLRAPPSAPPDGATLAFFVAPRSSLSDYVCCMCGVDAVSVCILDVANNSRHCLQPDEPLSTAALHVFASRYNRQELEAEVLGDAGYTQIDFRPYEQQTLYFTDQTHINVGEEDP
ncbi:nucleoredoxin [Hyalella azteca]|uniref:Nucleoredoxin n=1 Tax=Hyalella azteca TaxID=294128 RepID=A0A979FV81_HYAAZ|nr:nucleoredoxin [Hyalella azteca]